MDETLNNQATEAENNNDSDTPTERSIEEQLQITALTLQKEREAKKKAEKEVKEYAKKMGDLEGKFNTLQQQLASVLNLVPEQPATPAPTEKKLDPMGSDINYQQAAKQVVTGLQSEMAALKSELERQQSEKDGLKLELAIQRAFVEAGGILSPDSSFLDILDLDDYPIEVIKRRLKPYIKFDGDDLIVVDREGKTELNKNGFPITLREKMEVLKNSNAYASNFRSENNNKGMGTPLNGKASNGNVKVKRVSKADLSAGRVDPRLIIDGSVVVVD